jgi:hypothetical protein
MSASAQFGQSLREARERCGLSVEQLSQQTSIPTADIEALECGAVEVLPRAMYRRAEARAYAEAVGLDPDVVLSELRRAALSPSGPTSESSRPPLNLGPAREPNPRAAEPVVREPVLDTAAITVALVQTPPRAVHKPNNNASRVGRALILLVIGCGALLIDRDSTPSHESVVTPAVTLPVVDPVAMMEEAVRIAEPPVAAPTLRRVLYEPQDPRIEEPRLSRPGARLEGGLLIVQSTPRGARVTVNGVGWGETPVAIRYLPMGTMRVRVAKADHRVEQRVVTLTRDEPRRTVRLTLPPLRRRVAAPAARASGDMLVITTVPAGARVTVNGIGWGTTPLSIPHLPAGAQRVRIVKEQFKSEERVVNVGEQQPGRLSLTLKPQS